MRKALFSMLDFDRAEK